nr:hypothetical protein [uncultured Bdellovibrio sp.]
MTNPIEEPIFASTVITSIAKADPNLFRLAKTIKRPGDKGLHLFAFSVQSNVNIEPLLESLKDEDFTDLFHWEEIQATSSIPSFGALLLILNKYNIFPSEECTREILDGIKKSRSPQHGSLSNNTNTLNLYKFLSSTTSTGYFRISSEMNLEDNELQLLVSKQTDDPSVFEFVAHQKINDATFNVNIGASGTLFISQKDAGTGFDGLFIDGDILLQLVKHDLIPSQDANLIFYRLSSGEKLFVSVKDFTEALQKDSDLDSIQIQCRSGKMINSCTELLEKNKELMKAAVKALAMHFLKK